VNVQQIALLLLVNKWRHVQWQHCSSRDQGSKMLLRNNADVMVEVVLMEQEVSTLRLVIVGSRIASK